MAPRTARSQSIPEELPPCPGPKLGRFQYHDSPIQWLGRLGEHDGGGENSGQGYVFHAIIQGRDFAVKVFKFFNPLTDEGYWGNLLGKQTPLDVAAYYTDPFYAECRAYGKIHEAIRKKEIRKTTTVPCHGFLFLQPRDQKLLAQRNVNLELDKVDRNYQRLTVSGFRARAIVKELVSSAAGVGSESLSQILGRIAELNRAGIYIRDIRSANFINGKVIDFGSSWTRPHALLNALDPRAALVAVLDDRAGFNSMVRDEDIPNPKGLQAIHRMRLRHRKTTKMKSEASV